MHEDGQGQEVSSAELPAPGRGGRVTDSPHLEPNEGRYVVDPPPGSYRLSMDPGGCERYAVKIEECAVQTGAQRRGPGK